jgi:dihydrofolate synthase/folylpolyglutamate synthase
MLANKDPEAIVAPLESACASLQIVEVPGQDSHPANAFGPSARSAASVAEALAALPDDGIPALIAGSLYLAGDVLAINEEVPD